MIDLKNKIIVVTGGNGLIGSAFVLALRSAGATCICADINCTNDLDTHQINIDITDENAVQTSIKSIQLHFGRIDGWVNNAYPRTADWGMKMEDFPIESWRKNLDMHLTGYYICCKYALETMTEQGYGSLVNIGSIHGALAPDFTVYNGTQMTSPVGYAAIKGGVLQLTRYLASYHGRSGVRVNTLSPGGIFADQNPVFVQNYKDRVPMGRMGLPEDISGGLVFLLSDASKYMTGQNLIIDGGWSIV
jgi:NAD(P)-dependent dehydrogenase (short-subunit alcohol dehydrogenase family)